MSTRAQQWNPVWGPLTKESIRRRHADCGSNHVSRRTHSAGTQYVGRTSPGVCYVLRGSCRYEFDGIVVSIASQQFAHLPGGEFHFSAGDDGVELVMVWPLPDDWPSSPAS